LKEAVQAAGQSVDLVLTLYREGLTDFQNVLQMEESLFLEQDNEAAGRGIVLKDLVRLYKALGGGWASE
jgi:outer membrane protein TolC